MKTQLPMSRYMETWLAATDSDQKLVGSFPDGVQTGEMGRQSGCYVLLRHDDVPYSFFLDRDTQGLTRAPEHVTHESLVQNYVFAERGVPTIALPEDFDDEVASAVQLWGKATGIDIAEVTVVAAKYLLSR